MVQQEIFTCRNRHKRETRSQLDCFRSRRLLFICGFKDQDRIEEEASSFITGHFKKDKHSSTFFFFMTDVKNSGWKVRVIISISGGMLFFLF